MNESVKLFTYNRCFVQYEGAPLPSESEANATLLPSHTQSRRILCRQAQETLKQDPER